MYCNRETGWNKFSFSNLQTYRPSLLWWTVSLFLESSWKAAESKCFSHDRKKILKYSQCTDKVLSIYFKSYKLWFVWAHILVYLYTCPRLNCTWNKSHTDQEWEYDCFSIISKRNRKCGTPWYLPCCVQCTEIYWDLIISTFHTELDAFNLERR